MRRVDLPLPARRWAESVLGEAVIEARPLSGGWTSRMLLLTTGPGQQVVLRSITKQPWRRHAEGLLNREAAVQTQLARTSVPAPRTLAVDATGEHAGDPSLLMTLLPGRLVLDRADDTVLETLAEVLGRIHAFRPNEQSRPREYQSWAVEAKRVVPDWASRPELWRAAFELLADDPPAYEPVFLHRDFHLGNVLWEGTTVTGVVDWVETSWGPARLDVAHCRTYLAMLHGPAYAERFSAISGVESGGRYWDVLDIVGYLPDPVKVAGPWREHGRPVTDDLARARLEEYLDGVLSS